MAELKVGTVVHFERLSPLLAIFRLRPEGGSRFPDYTPGQYIALRREHCRLTTQAVGPDGRSRYVPDLDEWGRPKLGPVTRSYSVASAPFESREHGHLEFYVIKEKDEYGAVGRLSSSLFEINPPADDKVTYVNRITGSFTLAKRASGFDSVLFVGTGTGLAPFVSMVKQLHYEACREGPSAVQYTLLHANRTSEELAYHQELAAIEASRRFDFVYLASVSRPSKWDFDDPRMGRGRANNLLRHILGMPLKEEEELEAAVGEGKDASAARAALERTVAPALPTHISRSELLKRLDPSRAVIMTCGNRSGMADVEYAAATHHIHFEKEDW